MFSGRDAAHATVLVLLKDGTAEADLSVFRGVIIVIKKMMRRRV